MSDEQMGTAQSVRGGVVGKETKIFDLLAGFAPFRDPLVVTDATVAKRGGRWWMYVAGKVGGREGIRIFSASLPRGRL